MSRWLADEVRGRLDWFIRIRWFAVAGTAAVIALARIWAGPALSLWPLAALTAWLALYNLGFRLLVMAEPPAVRLALFTRVQVVLDLITLTGLLYFSGGIDNPFSFFFVFHAVLAGILLPRAESILVTTLAVLLYSLMALLEFSGILPHFALPAGPHPAAMLVVGRLAAFAATLYIVCYLTITMSERLAERTRALTEANRALRQADENRVKAVMRVTHELRAPVAAVKSLLDTVSEGYVKPACYECAISPMLERARARVTNLMKFEDDLLDLQKLELGYGALERIPLRLDAEIRRVVENLAGFAETRGVTVDLSGVEETPPVPADPRAVTTILANLISNAIKYNRPSGSVFVLSRSLDGAVEVRVRDTGVGIPAHDLGRVFELFFQGEYARQQKREGVGLGLSLVKGLVEAHGGTITVSSEEGKGSEFIFQLPVGNQESQIQNPKPADPGTRT